MTGKKLYLLFLFTMCALLALALLLGGCGKGEETTTTAAAATQTTASTATTASSGTTAATAGTTAATTQTTAAAAQTDTSLGPVGQSTKDSVVCRVAAEITNLNAYALPGNTAIAPVICSVMEGLTAQDYKDTKIINGQLADSWDWDANHLGITFHLRKGVKFSNGNDFNADDVVYTFTTIAPKTSLASMDAKIDCANITKVDDYTVHLPLTAIDEASLSILSQWKIYDKEYTEANANDPYLYTSKVVGTGPYKVTDYAPTDHVTLVRNDSWWGGTPNIKNVNVRVIPDASVAYMELLAGTVNLCWDATKEDADYYAKQSSGSLKSTEVPGMECSDVWYCFDGPFKDVNLRLAVAYAIDRDALLSSAYGNCGHVLNGLMPTQCEGYIEVNPWPITPDQAKAKQYLATAGYANGTTLTMMAMSVPQVATSAEQIKNMLAKIGITLKLTIADPATFFDSLMKAKDFDCYMFHMGSGAAPAQWSNALLNFFITNWSRGTDATVNNWATAKDVLTKVNNSTSSDERMKYWQQFTDSFFTDYFYYYPLIMAGSYNIQSADLYGVALGASLFNVQDFYFK
jgi:peptide/nickel transport system substrate-binding protein